jgi:zona occludens toxin (predicted ATPase)
MVKKNDKNDESNKLLYNSLKIWIFLVIVFTILYFVYLYMRDDYIMEILRDHKVECLQTLTPQYPPPLLNFVDSIDSIQIPVQNII